MILWAWGIAFFAVTFVPRYFTFMNFGYGYSDFGLYAQVLAALSRFDLNPVLPTFGHSYLSMRPGLWIYLLLPVSLVTTSPAVILFLDEIAILIAAFVCARFAWKKSQNRALESAIFLAVLFSPLTFDALHAPTRVTVWAQAPLALLMTEFLSHRRPGRLALWFGTLCLLDLHFGALAGLLIPLALLGERKRWNFQRRLLVALPIAGIGAAAVALLRFLGGRLGFDTELFFQVEGWVLLTWLITFWCLPFFSLQIMLTGLYLMLLKTGTGVHDASLLVPLGAIGASRSLELLAIKEDWLKKIIAAGLVATAVYYNLRGSDPFFTPWKTEHHRMTASSKMLDDLLAHVPPQAPVLVSDPLTPRFADDPAMASLSSAAARTMAPDFVVSLNEPTPFDRDPRYRIFESNSSLGARLLKRIK